MNGSQHSSVNQFYWTIAPAPPPAPPVLIGEPDADTTSTTAVLTFEGADGLEFECSLDSGAWETCTSPAIYVGLGCRSSHVLRAVASSERHPEHAVLYVVVHPQR